MASASTITCNWIPVEVTEVVEANTFYVLPQKGTQHLQQVEAIQEHFGQQSEDSDEEENNFYSRQHQRFQQDVFSQLRVGDVVAVRPSKKVNKSYPKTVQLAFFEGAVIPI